MQPLADYERRFRRAGLPLFIEDLSAREDVWTRVSPFLLLVFIGELLGAAQLDWPLLANVGAVLGGLAIGIGAFGLLNLARGRRFFSLPRDVGPAELAGFVLVPAVLPLIFGGQLGQRARDRGGERSAPAGGIRGDGLRSVRDRAVDAAPAARANRRLGGRAVAFGTLLMVFALVLFVNTEMWQVFSRMPDAFLVLAGILVLLLGLTFVVVRLPREVRLLEREAGGGAPLNSRQRVNVALVLLAGQGLQAVVVSAAVTVVFVVFGALAVGPVVRDTWEVAEGATIVSFTLFGDRIEITEALLRVAAAIGALSGLYYAIAVLTDPTYRQEFLEEVTAEMRETFTARAEYLALRAHEPLTG